MQNTTRKRLLQAAAVAGLAVAGRAIQRQISGYDFHDRNVLITGSSRGLGLVLCRKLAKRGARLTLCARDAEELKQAEFDLLSRGARVLTIRCDVTQRTQVKHLITEVERLRGPIDVVINNAGVIQAGPVETMTVEDYEHAMQTHFFASLYVNEEVLPRMRFRGQGRIVNIASIGGRIPVPHLLPYCASKFALTGYSLGLRNEVARDGVVVTTVCPGLMRTGSPRNAFFKGQHRSEYRWFKLSSSIPILSVSANHAARRIINACSHGDAFVVFGWPMQLAEKAAALSPSLTSQLLTLVNRMLPGPGGIGQSQASGAHSESPTTRSWLTHLTQKAALRNNENWR